MFKSTRSHAPVVEGASTKMSTPATIVVLLLIVTLPCSSADGDVINSFLNVAGTPNGEFGWDNFSGTYGGPHQPDQFAQSGTSSTITANSGGLITSTMNLYSFFSVPAWTADLGGLDSSNLFTSVAVQFATSSQYGESQFLLDGLVPDEFYRIGDGPVIGGFPVNLYWAEWQGLNAASSYSVSLQGTGQHQSLAGVKASYFNTNSPYNILAVPEPHSVIFAGVAFCVAIIRRRGVR